MFSQNFGTLAQAVSMMVENLNMQMESEYADLVDRNLMSLYGAKPIDPEVKGKRSGSVQKLKYGDYSLLSASGLGLNRVVSKYDEDGDLLPPDQEVRLGDIQSVDKLKHDPSEPLAPDRNFDDIREQSGRIIPPPKGIPVTLQQKCMTHQTNGQDA